jgi:hypothetical protein
MVIYERVLELDNSAMQARLNNYTSIPLVF